MRRLSSWFSTQTPRGQLLSGCIGILTLSTCLLYVLGAVSLFIRPYIFTTPVAAATVNVIVPPTEAPTLTPQAASTLELPQSTLIATPTQAPIPTRAPTSTPTVGEIPSITPQGTPASGNETPTNTIVPLTATNPPATVTNPPPTNTRVPKPTNTPGPTRTRKPTKTPATGKP